jgi:DNA-binding MarR family transcriptional regulator
LGHIPLIEIIPMLKPPDETCSCFSLRKAARRVTAFYDQTLSAVGLRSTQYSLLVEIDDAAEPMTILRLARAMVMDRSTLGHNLRPLLREGFVALEVGRDRRSRELRLTASGDRKLKEARPLWRAAEDTLQRNFGKDRALALQALTATVASEDFALAPVQAGASARQW